MKRHTTLLLMIMLFGNSLANSKIDLSGIWSFRMDPHNEGISSNWQQVQFSETVTLPGSMTTNGKGNNISPETRWTATNWSDGSWHNRQDFEKYRNPDNPKFSFWLTPAKEYVGPAWYSRTVNIPAGWMGKAIYLKLERCHWETTVWVNGKKAGLENSLSTPHNYNLTNLLKKGENSISIRVDNSIREINPGLDAHSISDNTQTNWNGIIGDIYLTTRPLINIASVKIFPDIDTGTAGVEMIINNTTEKASQKTLKINIESFNTERKHLVPAISRKILLQPGKNQISIKVLMGKDFQTWDEHHPALYRLSAGITGLKESIVNTSFGMRQIKSVGTQFTVNNKAVFLRGTLECAIFPLTGFPPTDIESWLKIMRQVQNFGLNHIRFHSWCPPKAAFIAADLSGVYLQVEAAAWATIGDGAPIDQFIYDETEKIINEYGNHPSFCLMAHGNEPHGKNHKEFLSRYLQFWKAKDNRRVYTSGAGWPELPENDYHNIPGPRIQHWNAGLKSSINALPPQTISDYSDIIQNRKVPVVSHEIGQWCVFPNFEEMKKYTGVLRPLNFELFQEDLHDRGMGHQAKDFLMASGKLQAICYKAEIEAALRTKGMAGFQLLDLRDFPGQGTALVGVLDAFWEEKGYITAEEYRRFCNKVVLLARLPKMTYNTVDTLSAEIDLFNFGGSEMTGPRINWKLTTVDNEIVATGNFKGKNYPAGQLLKVGRVQIPLHQLKSPAKYSLVTDISETNYTNRWDIWLYPEKLPAVDHSIRITNQLDEATISHLANGGDVLLSFRRDKLKPDQGGNVDFGFSPVFWNTSWTKNQAPHTLGILCNPQHPAFRYFPTEYHSNWQWWELIQNAGAMRTEHFPAGFTSIVQPIHTWFDNYKLSMIFEARVLKGRIIVVSSDIITEDLNKLVARQLRYSLLKYMSGEEFAPANSLEMNHIRDLLK